MPMSNAAANHQLMTLTGNRQYPDMSTTFIVISDISPFGRTP
jgi:hypothetical protein